MRRNCPQGWREMSPSRACSFLFPEPYRSPALSPGVPSHAMLSPPAGPNAPLQIPWSPRLCQECGRLLPNGDQLPGPAASPAASSGPWSTREGKGSQTGTSGSPKSHPAPSRSLLRSAGTQRWLRGSQQPLTYPTPSWDPWDGNSPAGMHLVGCRDGPAEVRFIHLVHPGWGIPPSSQSRGSSSHPTARTGPGQRGPAPEQTPPQSSPQELAWTGRVPLV